MAAAAAPAVSFSPQSISRRTPEIGFVNTSLAPLQIQLTNNGAAVSDQIVAVQDPNDSGVFTDTNTSSTTSTTDDSGLASAIYTSSNTGNHEVTASVTIPVDPGSSSSPTTTLTTGVLVDTLSSGGSYTATQGQSLTLAASGGTVVGLTYTWSIGDPGAALTILPVNNSYVITGTMLTVTGATPTLSWVQLEGLLYTAEMSSQGVLGPSGLPSIPVVLTVTGAGQTISTSTTIQIPIQPMSAQFNDINSVAEDNSESSADGTLLPTSLLAEYGAQNAVTLLEESSPAFDANTASGYVYVTIPSGPSATTPNGLPIDLTTIPMPDAYVEEPYLPTSIDVSQVNYLTITHYESNGTTYTTGATILTAPLAISQPAAVDGMVFQEESQPQQNALSWTLSGTPTAAGTFTFTLTAASSLDSFSSLQLTLTVLPPPIVPSIPGGATLSTSASTLSSKHLTLQPATAGTSYNLTGSAYAGNDSLSYSLSSFSYWSATAENNGLDGLTFTSTSSGWGLSGTPSAPGVLLFAVTANNTTYPGNSATQWFVLDVNPALEVTSTLLPPAVFGSSYDYQLTATGGSSSSGVSFVLAPNSSPPPGLPLSSGGEISGTPTALGTFTFTVDASDDQGDFAAATITLAVNPAPTTTVVDASNDSPVYGHSVTFTAAAFTAGNVPVTTGSVTFYDETTSTSLGVVPIDPSDDDASLTLSTLLAGNNTITATFNEQGYEEPPSAPDYGMSSSSITVSASPQQLTVTANAITIPYGTSIPTLTYTISGLVNGDTINDLGITGALSTPAGAVGSIPQAGNNLINLGTLAISDGNYTISNFVIGELTVTPAPLTVTAANVTTDYNNPLPALSYTYTGLVNGDSSASFTGDLGVLAMAGSAPGTYPIDIDTLAATGNYSVGELAVPLFQAATPSGLGWR